jgi:hypothetical protein
MHRCLENPAFFETLPFTNDLLADAVKKNPLKQIFSTQAGKEKRGYPPPQSVGEKWVFSVAIDDGAHCHGECKRWISSFAAPSLACLFVVWLPSLRSCFGAVLWTVFDTIFDAVFDAGMIVLPTAFRINSLVPLLRPDFCSLPSHARRGLYGTSY